MKDNGAAAAFPVTEIETDLTGDGSGQKYPHVYTYENGSGMTKREYFAALAMQGMMAEALVDRQVPGTDHTEAKVWAERAVMMADALLDALK